MFGAERWWSGDCFADKTAVTAELDVGSRYVGGGGGGRVRAVADVTSATDHRAHVARMRAAHCRSTTHYYYYLLLLLLFFYLFFLFILNPRKNEGGKKIKIIIIICPIAIP